jgi:hypothetical protein
MIGLVEEGSRPYQGGRATWLFMSKKLSRFASALLITLYHTAEIGTSSKICYRHHFFSFLFSSLSLYLDAG